VFGLQEEIDLHRILDGKTFRRFFEKLSLDINIRKIKTLSTMRGIEKHILKTGGAKVLVSFFMPVSSIPRSLERYWAFLFISHHTSLPFVNSGGGAFLWGRP
jgi:hypothetical protein